MSLTDINAFMVVAVVFVVVLVAVVYSYGQVITEMVPVLGAGSRASSFMIAIQDAYAYLDYMLLFSYVGFLIGSIITAWFVKTHPVFFIFFMIGSLFTTFIAWIFSQTIDEYVNVMPEFLAVFNSFPLTNSFVLNLPIYVLGASCVIAIIQYSKISGGW